MAEERVCHFYLPTCPPTLTVGHASAVPLIHTLTQLCEWGGQWHLTPPLLLRRYHRCCTAPQRGHNLPTEAAMENMDPTKCTCFRNIFHAMPDDISKGISTSRSTDASGHWENWDSFCRGVDLDPLLVLYRDPFPILNAFSRQ